MKPVDNKLEGRLALITGASGGIGSAIARSLYRQGCHLALTYNSGTERIAALVASLEAEPSSPPSSSSSTTTKPTISTHQCDLSSDASISALLPSIQASHSGHTPDILISNAGYGKRIVDIASIPPAEFDAMYATNLRASFLLTQLCVAGMRARGWGRVVYIGSIAAVGGGINGCHYAASKAGLLGMMRNLAGKHAREGVTFNDVAPAMIVDTGMIPSEDTVKGTAGDPENIPVGRLGTPEEVAGVVECCCRTGYMTGQSIVLSGGLK